MAAGEVIRDKMVRKLASAKSLKVPKPDRAKLQAQKVELYSLCTCGHCKTAHRTVGRGSCVITGCKCSQWQEREVKG